MVCILVPDRDKVINLEDPKFLNNCLYFNFKDTERGRASALIRRGCDGKPVYKSIKTTIYI